MLQFSPGNRIMLHFDHTHDMSSSAAFRVFPRSREWARQRHIHPNGFVYCLVSPASLDNWQVRPDNMNLVRTVFRQRVEHCEHCFARHSTFTPEERYLNSVEFTLCKPRALRNDEVFRREGFHIPYGFSPLAEYVLPHGNQYYIYQAHIRPFLTTGPRVWTVPIIGDVWYCSRFTHPATVRDKCADYGKDTMLACGARRTVHSLIFRTDTEHYMPLHDLLAATTHHEIDWIAECIASFLVDISKSLVMPDAVHNVRLRNQRAVQCRLRAHAILTRSPGPLTGFEGF